MNKEIIDKDYIDNLSFDKEQKKLCFIIKNYRRQPKITSYKTINYQKFPIYGGYSERTKVVKKFDKKINPLRFVNEDILNLNLDKNFVLEIINKIGIIPEWRKKEIKLENIKNELDILNNSIRSFKKEKNHYLFKRVDFQQEPDDFLFFLFIGFFVLFINFCFYVSKKKALINKEINKINTLYNKEHKDYIDNLNEKLLFEINNSNEKINTKIDFLKNKYSEIESKPIKILSFDQEGWTDLIKASIFKYKNLINKKGVYVIWNKTKNKYYVGQSKNIGLRLLNHFKDGEVKNVIFAKDFFDGDVFMFKYKFCQLKDELDSLEKSLIDEYNSFENGYNKTGGNK